MNSVCAVCMRVSVFTEIVALCCYYFNLRPRCLGHLPSYKYEGTTVLLTQARTMGSEPWVISLRGHWVLLEAKIWDVFTTGGKNCSHSCVFCQLGFLKYGAESPAPSRRRAKQRDMYRIFSAHSMKALLAECTVRPRMVPKDLGSNPATKAVLSVPYFKKNEESNWGPLLALAARGPSPTGVPWAIWSIIAHGKSAPAGPDTCATLSACATISVNTVYRIVACARYIWRVGSYHEKEG
jgi:hypothetical protein